MFNLKSDFKMSHRIPKQTDACHQTLSGLVDWNFGGSHPRKGLESVRLGMSGPEEHLESKFVEFSKRGVFVGVGRVFVEVIGEDNLPERLVHVHDPTPPVQGTANIVFTSSQPTDICSSLDFAQF